MEPRGCQGESGWVLRMASAFTAVQVDPGLTSWVILSRPRSTSSGQALAGLVRLFKPYPALTCWATFSRPFGTDRDTPRSLIVFSECRTNRTDRKANLDKTEFEWSTIDLDDWPNASHARAGHQAATSDWVYRPPSNLPTHIECLPADAPSSAYSNRYARCAPAPQ